MASSWCLSRADTYAVMSATRGPRSSWGGKGPGSFLSLSAQERARCGQCWLSACGCQTWPHAAAAHWSATARQRGRGLKCGHVHLCPSSPTPSRLVRPEICSLPTQAPSLPGRSGARSSLRAHNRDRLCHPRCAPPSFP